MSTMEDRLSAALAARAELVQPEDLAPLTTPAPVGSPFRRPAVWLAAAAACAAVVSSPFVVGALQDDDARPPVTVDGADWPVVSETKLDLTGDGKPDAVRLRSDGAQLRVETGEAALLLSVSGPESRLVPEPLDLNGDGASEVLVEVRSSEDGAEYTEYAVTPVALIDGKLVEPHDPPLDVRRGAQGDLHGSDYWVTDDGLLLTASYLDLYDAGDAADSEVYATLRVWRWDDSGLVVETKGVQCAQESELPAFAPCPGAPADSTVDLTMREPGETALPGEKRVMQLDDGPEDVIGLAGPRTGDCIAHPKDTWQLVVASSAHGNQSVPLAAGPMPELAAYPILMDNPYGQERGVLVRRIGCDTDVQVETWFWRADGLYPVEVSPKSAVPLEGDGYQTWVDPEGRLVTMSGEQSGSGFRTWTWAVNLRDVLVPTEIEATCEVAEDGTLRPC